MRSSLPLHARQRVCIFLSRESRDLFFGSLLFLSRVFSPQTVVVVGETGSGKSTQIPQFLYEAGITGGGGGWGAAGGKQGG